ncbi:MAG TPA: PQ-loop domain-containing transporter [Acidimicrobiales bacterium]|nr:PQ-loop domain-containing transporter [Acidimicrobiales bacterium]
MIIATAALTSVLAVIAPVLTIFQSGAQAQRIRRTGARGVSLATWLLSVFVAQTWLCYGFVFHVPAEVWANVPAMSVALVVAYLAAKSQGQLLRSVGAYVALLAVTVAATWTGSSAPHHWILSDVSVISSVVIYVPQLVLVMRSKDLTGVSAISWFLACLTAASWLVYGLLIHQPAVALPSFVMLPAAMYILVGVLRHRVKNDPARGLQAPIIE